MIPGDTTEQRRSTGWDFLQRPGMIYALVLALVAVTFLARSLVAPTLGTQSLYLFLMPAVLIAGIVGGLGPGLLATFLCVVLHLYVTGEYAISQTSILRFLRRRCRAPSHSWCWELGLPGPASGFSDPRLLRMRARTPRWRAKRMSSRSSIPFRTPWW